MECPKCKMQMEINEELSHGMGNQSIEECPFCRLICLVSGETITQTWEPDKIPA